MEYRKSNNTPRERIDDTLLLRILEEEEPVNCTYGNCTKNNNATRNERSYRVTPRMEHSEHENCDENCAKTNSLSGRSLAMVYSPDQEWRELYCDEDAMNHGTIFTELYKPFYHGCSGSCR